MNPFFGYPVSSAPGLARHPSVPGLRHGRRRKRDLVRTLLVLWWERWGTSLKKTGVLGALLGLCWVLLQLKKRRRLGT